MSETNTSSQQSASMMKTTSLLGLGITIAVVGMMVLGILLFTGNESLRMMHEMIGYMVLVLGLAASWCALRASSDTGSKGTFFHALGVTVLMALQIVLGKIGQAHVHMAVGALILIGAIGLWTMAGRKAKALPEGA